MKDRRRVRRRSIPYVRSAVLEVGSRAHIAAVTDLSPEGAFLTTRVPLGANDKVRLKIVLPRDGREVAIAGQVVWRSERFDAATGRPAGVAVRFLGADAATIRRVEEFSAEGFLPGPGPTPSEHFEYRVIEREILDAEELNRLGRDGWMLVTALTSAPGIRLVLMRRL